MGSGASAGVIEEDAWAEMGIGKVELEPSIFGSGAAMNVRQKTRETPLAAEKEWEWETDRGLGLQFFPHLGRNDFHLY